jgi:hypothetical protein
VERNDCDTCKYLEKSSIEEPCKTCCDYAPIAMFSRWAEREERNETN